MKKVCEIEIRSVSPLGFEEINEFHAEQEAMPLDELKVLINKIYPSTNKLYVISYKLVTS